MDSAAPDQEQWLDTPTRIDIIISEECWRDHHCRSPEQLEQLGPGSATGAKLSGKIYYHIIIMVFKIPELPDRII